MVQAGAVRDVFVELAEEDADPGSCDTLKKSIYVTRDAAQNWGQCLTQFMTGAGFKSGQSSPCVFWNKDRTLRFVVHGDDFAIL